MSENLEKISINIKDFLDDDVYVSFNNINENNQDKMLIEFENVDVFLLLEDSKNLIDVSKFLNSNLDKENMISSYSIL